MHVVAILNDCWLSSLILLDCMIYSTEVSMASSSYPRAFVFDLDGCVWYPEMYMLWSSGGSPFRRVNQRELEDAGGTRVVVLADVRAILRRLYEEKRHSELVVGVASGCDEPAWGRECLRNFRLYEEETSSVSLMDVFEDNVEIYKGSKAHHMRALAQRNGLKLEEMVFFDNEMNNCLNVANKGATAVYTPHGVTWALFEEAINAFPAKKGHVVNGKGNRWR